ncbi:MAG TPA: sucrose phosphorylase [Burkholderiaceae bacterium]|jgi:sucrose phosphorylase
MKNQAQLITYVDRLAGGGFRELKALLDGPLSGVFGGVHLLPFFDPIDGADAGFDPIDHTSVDSRLGTWDDVRELSAQMELMADVIVNHMSAESPQFKDFSALGSESRFDGLFLTFDRIFPDGATEAALLEIYRPRPGLPLRYTIMANGQRRILWSTFTAQQVDIDVHHPLGQAYLDSILTRLSSSGVRMVRLDAVGYAIKKAGGSCFMTPQTFAFIEQFAARAKELNMEVLVEVHSHYGKQIEIAERVDWVYDFALPPLLLHAFFFGTAESLKQWIDIRPQNSLTVLDTHDGIGVIDIGADPADRDGRPGLVPPHELDRLVEIIHENSRGESRLATGAAASNLDLYQVNCTYYDALGRNDLAYLLARAVQCFLPGIPQVYYVGLLAGTNDMALLEKTGVGRDINRHFYRRSEAEAELDKPIVRQLLDLLRLRNTSPAFNGSFQSLSCSAHGIDLLWTHETHAARLTVDFSTLAYSLTHGSDGTFASLRFETAKTRETEALIDIAKHSPLNTSPLEKQEMPLG